MRDNIKILLTVLSAGVGLYTGFFISLLFFMFSSFSIISLLGLSEGSGWVAIFLIPFLSMGSAILWGTLLGMISFGKFNSEKWKINRYIIIFIFLLIGIILQYKMDFF